MSTKQERIDAVRELVENARDEWGERGDDVDIALGNALTALEWANEDDDEGGEEE